MANCNQEQPLPQSFQEFPEFEEASGINPGDIRRFAMMDLNATPPCRRHHHHEFTPAATTTTATCDVRVRPLERCTSCGSLKRRSPSSLSPIQEPSAKRPALHHTATTEAAIAGDQNQNNSLGSGKLPPHNAAPSATPIPPITFETRHTVLNRSCSDITSYMGTQETGETSANAQILNSQSGEISKTYSVSSSPSPAVGTLPPLPPVLQRSSSAPIPSDCQPVADSTPSKAPSVARTSVSSPNSDQESASTKRLRRIQERMKEMSQWVEKVAVEGDENEDNCSESDNSSDKNPKEMCEKEPETRPYHTQAVQVEEKGGNLIIHFKCPCGKGYEIFLCGNKCYYALT